MANSTASLTVTLAYTGPDSEAITAPRPTFACLYQAQSVGEIDIPDTTAMSTTLPVPFGSIDTECTLAYLENKTSQPLQVNINGAAAPSHRIPAGGFLLLGGPAAAGGDELLSIDLITTALQVGDQKVAYRLFGDPTP